MAIENGALVDDVAAVLFSGTTAAFVGLAVAAISTIASIATLATCIGFKKVEQVS